MYCFFYLCHEEAAIIKVCVEVSQYRGGGVKGRDRLCEYLRYSVCSFFYSDCFQLDTHIHTLCSDFYHCCQHNVHVGTAEKPKYDWSRRVKSQWQTCHTWKTFQFLIIIQKVETIRCLSLKGFFCFVCFLFNLNSWFVSSRPPGLSLCLQQSGKTPCASHVVCC